MSKGPYSTLLYSFDTLILEVNDFVRRLLKDNSDLY